MAYIAPIHGPSGIRHAVKLKLLDTEVECLVVAKSNTLEIFEQTDNGLVRRHSKSIYGKISMLQKLRPEDAELDHLFVGTDRHAYFTLAWDTQAKQLRTAHIIPDQAEKVGRDSQTAERCLVDPTERFMVLDLFEGVITIIPLTKRGRRKADPITREVRQPIPVRVDELFIRSSSLLYGRGNAPEKESPLLALMYEDNQQQARLKFRRIEAEKGGDLDLVEDDRRVGEALDPGASHLIPVPGPVFGLLVLAETSITYIDETQNEKIVKIPLEEATIWVAWVQIDDRRWLLADDYGNLYFLMIEVGGEEDDQFEGYRLDFLGKVSRAAVLIYLGEGNIFIGSHSGDSQVIKIQERKVEITQTIANLGPILDFTVMDMGSRSSETQTNEYSSGQARIVTGSGAFDDGSLRSVRSGVGLEDFGSLGDYGHITNLFSLRSSSHTQFSDTLMVSSINETRILQFNSDGEAEEMEMFLGLDLRNDETLLAANLPSGRLLHCTSHSLKIVDLDSGVTSSDWSPEPGGVIVAASANEDCVALSISGTKLVVLDFRDPNQLEVLSAKELGARNQISCINVPSIMSGVCIVGFWQSADISILKLENLEEIQSTKVSNDAAAVPRSVLLTQILQDKPPTLFIALADGNVTSYDVEGPKYDLSGKKSTILGTQQANLTCLPRDDGLFNVFATCEHPSLIYGSEGRLVFSAVTADKASCICHFNAEAYPGAIAIATPDEIRISLVDTERTTHIQSLPFGETVRRIAYSTKKRAFGLGTIKRSMQSGIEIVQSFFKLVDEIVFKELDTFTLNEDELVESVLRADLSDGSPEETTAERFIVGTAYLLDEDAAQETMRGRIIIFDVTQERKLKVVAERAVKGACRALASMGGNIVAALIKSILVFSVRGDKLNRLAGYRTSTAPIALSVVGDLIAVADLMKSLSLVKYTPPGEGGENASMIEVGRHFEVAWATAAAAVQENIYLESDSEGNLVVLHQNVNGVTAYDKRRLEVICEIQLGELVNRIQPIDVAASPNAIVAPRAFLATTDGSIYLFGLIHESKQDLLMTLQSNIAANVKNLGDIDFLHYRAFHNQVRQAHEPYRFVDGELVERFLDCSLDEQQSIVQGLSIGLEEVKAMIEGLRRMH